MFDMKTLNNKCKKYKTFLEHFLITEHFIHKTPRIPTFDFTSSWVA